MEGFFILLSLCVVMALASFLAGTLPLSLPLSHGRLQLISTIGIGVLVGTSLIVIIPEGVETLYSAGSSGYGHEKRQVRSETVFTHWTTAKYIEPGPTQQPPRIVERASIPDNVEVVPTFGVALTMTQDTPEKTHKTLQKLSEPESTKQEDEDHEHEHTDSHENQSPHIWVGTSLIAGFMLMFLIDEVPRLVSSASKRKHRPYHIVLNDLGRGLHRVSSREEVNDETLNSTLATRPTRGFAITTGLVIHAAADGIALGASTGTTTSLSFIIFMAIMLHKAPAAFGLTSILLKQGISKREARASLIIFSLAAPVGAIATWTIASVVGGSQMDEAGTRWWTGVLLLFSGGTFLYVAMHSMQEDSTHSGGNHAHGFAEGREARQESGRSLQNLLAAIIGMLLPLFLQFGHAH